jgi:hypothetical protein
MRVAKATSTTFPPIPPIITRLALTNFESTPWDNALTRRNTEGSEGLNYRYCRSLRIWTHRLEDKRAMNG